MNIHITYTSRQDNNYEKCFKPLVWVNNKYHYHTERGKKTYGGALRTAKRIAEELAIGYKYNNLNNVTVEKLQRDITLDERKANADILIEYANGGSFTIKLQSEVDLGSKRGIKRYCENGMIEVTENKLNQLRKFYKVECNF